VNYLVKNVMGRIETVLFTLGIASPSVLNGYVKGDPSPGISLGV